MRVTGDSERAAFPWRTLCRPRTSPSASRASRTAGASSRCLVLPFDDASFDACLIALSVQYLTRPSEVFAEIGRVLVSGGVCAVSFSNRCFPTKAVAVWHALDDSGHIGLVTTYLRQADLFEEPVYADLSPHPGRSDPLFVVTAKRNGH